VIIFGYQAFEKYFLLAYNSCTADLIMTFPIGNQVSWKLLRLHEVMG
jgi:hypothetical protein